MHAVQQTAWLWLAAMAALITVCLGHALLVHDGMIYSTRGRPKSRPAAAGTCEKTIAKTSRLQVSARSWNHRNNGQHSYIPESPPYADATGLEFVEAKLKSMRALPADEKRRAISDLCLQIVQTDPQLSLQVFHAIPLTSDRLPLLNTLAMEWAIKDDLHALEYALKILDRSGREQFIAGVISGMAQANPEDGASVLTLLPAKGDLHEQALHTTIAHWIELDPSEAVVWIDNLPDQQEKSSILREAISQWTHSDPVASASWLMRLPAGMYRDLAMDAYISELGSQAPREALTRAFSTITPPRLERTLIEVARQWISREPNVAAAWIAQSNLPPAAKQDLLSPARHY